MTLQDAISIGKDCGLETVEECVDNIGFHSTMLFEYSNITAELEELIHEYKKYKKEL